MTDEVTPVAPATDILDELFTTDTDLERQGRVFYYGPETWVKLARAGGDNLKFLKAWERECQPYQEQIARNILDESIMQRIIAKVFSETVVLSWGGIAVEGKANVPCTPENIVKKMMSNKNLTNDWFTKATTLSNFRKASLDAAIKN